MKLILHSSSLLLTIIGIIGNLKLARAGGVLRRGAVGRLRIGMRLGEVLAEIPGDWTARLENHTVRIYSSKESNQLRLIGDVTNGAISQFQVFSEQFRTDVGIGIGSTLTELGRFYQTSSREPGYAYVEPLHMRFEIRDDKIITVLVS